MLRLRARLHAVNQRELCGVQSSVLGPLTSGASDVGDSLVDAFARRQSGRLARVATKSSFAMDDAGRGRLRRFVVALHDSGGALDGGPAGAIVNGFQVAVGLLLLSVTAATSLAEERARGSLDLLLSTPLSTRQIVLGKWLGAFRVVPLLVILPAL